MRYNTARKYPITQMKKDGRLRQEEHSIDISLGTAMGIIAFAFAEGIFWGYMARKWRK
jgi:hypothetical protein